MLTKSDFQKIGNLIDIKVTAIIDERVPAIIDQRVPAIIDQHVPEIINRQVPAIIERLVPGIISKTVPAIIKQELKPIKERLARIEKVIKIDFNYLDRLHIKNVKAINKIESHLGFPESELMIP